LHAQEACSAEKAEIDRRLAQPGRSAEQIEQGEQLKQVLTMMCSAGGAQAGALIAAQLDIVLPSLSGVATDEPALTGADLTNEYLQGQWCRIGQESTSYDFAADGSYRYAVVGFNVTADGHAYFDEILPRASFLERFDTVVTMESDRFVTSTRTRGGSSEMTFERGECAFMSVGAAG
jgi:hypothetical protein